MRSLSHYCLPIILAFVPAAASAHEIKQKGLQIVHPWAYESGPASAATADVFMKIRNIGHTADRLVSATTGRAAQANLVAGSRGNFAIDPGREFKLDETTGHIRLSGLNKPLYVNDDFPLTLIFERAGRIEVEVHIEELRDPAPESSHKH